MLYFDRILEPSSCFWYIIMYKVELCTLGDKYNCHVYFWSTHYWDIIRFVGARLYPFQVQKVTQIDPPTVCLLSLKIIWWYSLKRRFFEIVYWFNVTIFINVHVLLMFMAVIELSYVYPITAFLWRWTNTYKTKKISERIYLTKTGDWNLLSKLWSK